MKWLTFEVITLAQINIDKYRCDDLDGTTRLLTEDDLVKVSSKSLPVSSTRKK